jgi:glycosyltransferase involved in cell wall biosynthesis
MDQYLILDNLRDTKVPGTRSSSDTLMRSHEEKKQRIKVLNITEEGRYGGPQSRIIKVAGLLKNMGIETTVICPVFDSDNFLNELKENGISHIPMRLHRMTLQLGHLIGFVVFFVPEVLFLRSVLLKNQSDIIHCNGCWQLKGMLAARLAGTDAQVIYHLNDTRTQPVIKYVFSFLARHLVDAFMPACQRSKEYYITDKRLKEKKYFITPAPVDTEKFDPEKVISDPRLDKLPGLKIITVCNINRGKGIDELIDLCDEVTKNYPQQPLSFAVVGPVHKNHLHYFSELKKKIEEKHLQNFYFLGGTNNVQTALKAADIYVCVSHFESSPMVVWEAMAMEKPIVSTDVGDVKIYLEKGKCGFCVPVGDVQAMKKKLGILINDQNTRRKMGKNARIFAVENLDLKICARKHAFFYKKLVSEKK